MPLSNRSRKLNPFHVMDILAQAKAMEQQGRTVYHMEVGEPDFTTADCIRDAGIEALRHCRTHYTPATGIPELRNAIAEYYLRKFAVKVDPGRIIVTPGASGAIQLAITCLLDAGEKVLLADPGYPCNKNIAEVLAVDVDAVAVGPETNYQLSSDLIAKHWHSNTRAAIVATPSNPTGTVLPESQLSDICHQVHKQGGCLIVDEIYQGLVYEAQDYTALSLSDNCFVINSFSKYFGMTGWRLGWMVAPEEYVDAIDRVSQNIFLAPPTISQYAALTALKQDTQVILDERRDEFRKRRDFLLPALEQIGFSIEAKPQGAFYIYAGCEAFTEDSSDWVNRLLHDQGVALAPGADFGDYQASTHCRLAYTQSIDSLEQAVSRIEKFTRR